MLISTALLLDSIIRNSVCTPAKLPCRRVEVGYEKQLKIVSNYVPLWTHLCPKFLLYNLKDIRDRRNRPLRTDTCILFSKFLLTCITLQSCISPSTTAITVFTNAMFFTKLIARPQYSFTTDVTVWRP
jgi:hypothetical protein